MEGVLDPVENHLRVVIVSLDQSMGRENDQAFVVHVHQGHHQILRAIPFRVGVPIPQGRCVAMVPVGDVDVLLLHFSLQAPDQGMVVNLPQLVQHVVHRTGSDRLGVQDLIEKPVHLPGRIRIDSEHHSEVGLRCLQQGVTVLHVL